MINIEELVVYLKVLSMKLNVITVGIFAYICLFFISQDYGDQLHCLFTT